MALVLHPVGGYRFLPGIDAYSRGVIAARGFEIVRVALSEPLPWRVGFDRIAAYLRREGRPRAALCAIELRSPRPFPRDGFAAFNGDYRAVLATWRVFVDGVNPVARTNVAPVFHPPAEPSLFAFSFTRPTDSGARSFVVAGAGELQGGPLATAPVVRAGETGPAAMAEKARFVMDEITARLAQLGAGWDEVTATQVYTAESLEPFVREQVLPRLGRAARHGIRWYAARPPIDELAFEMDARAVAAERWLG